MRAVGAGAVVLLVLAGAVAIAQPAAAATPDANPTIPRQCGLDVTLVLDASGSVQSSNAVGAVRSAADAFLTAFQDTGSSARVLQFGSLAEVLAGRAVVSQESMGDGGAFRDAVDEYYPAPERPAGVTIRSFNSGSITASGSFSTSNTSTQYTNWDQAMRLTAEDPGDLVVFVTDGDPTGYDFRATGDPFRPPDVAVRTDRNATISAETLDRSVTSANAVKAADARVLAIGVGNALQNAASVQRLTQMSGDDVARSIADFDVETTDVALVADFNDLAAAVRSLVLDLCSPSLTVRKLAQTQDDAAYSPAEGWDITTTPTVPGGFAWVLPEGATGPSVSVETNVDGYAQFQWEPTVPDTVSSASVSEVLPAGWIAGRPDGDDYRCEFRNAAGGIRVAAGELTTAAGSATFELAPIGNEIGACTVYNSFEYAPAIQIEKVNDPPVVRGDLQPGAAVTSTYAVTNPGNTALANVTVSDDTCAPVVGVPATGDNIGDTDADGLLDADEEWTFACVREMNASLRATPAAVVQNTATVTGIDPAGTVVSDAAVDDVELYTPAISLTKLVDGADSATRTLTDPATTVLYTYAATNTGNTALGGVTLTDDTPPCESPTRGADAPGDDDAVLDVGETWTYACTAAPTGSVINTATVEGIPLDPGTGAPFAGANPVVTASDVAGVRIVEPGLTLTKSVDRPLVLPGSEVEYTYTAVNTGTIDLRNDTGNPGWIADDACVAVTSTGGDLDGDGLLDANAAETWTFTCRAVIQVTTPNVATMIAQPVDAGAPVGAPLTRRDVALVRVVEPEITLTKLALVPVVLDPDAAPVAGPDAPAPRPARYLYEVDNPGGAPIRDVALSDDKCAPVVYSTGDLANPGVLDPGETWEFTCATTLERQQATPDPGDESGLVQNNADVRGEAFVDDDTREVGAADSAQVTVIEPSVTLEKTASAAVVRPGTGVEYTFMVANTGDVGVDSVALIDDTCADIVFVGGDGNGNGLIDGANSGAAEEWEYSCTRAVGAPPPPASTDLNEASVIVVDPLGNLYAAADTAEVRVIDPAIDLVKSVSQTLVPAGTTVTYGFAVTNVGQSAVAADDVLADIVLGDESAPDNPACRAPAFAGGDTDGDGMLARDPAETWTYTCTGVIDEPTLDVAGVVGIGGTMHGLRLPVSAASAQFVQPFHPGLEVVKTADPSEVPDPGGDVTYTYEARNTGDVPLAAVADSIADDTCAPVAYVTGDEDGDGLLDTADSIFEDARDETWVFTCTTFVREDTVNTVVASGSPTDADGVDVCAPETGGVLLQAGRIGTPCDVTADATAEVTVSTLDPDDLPPTGAEIPWFAALLGVGALGAGALLMSMTRGGGRPLGSRPGVRSGR